MNESLHSNPSTFSIPHVNNFFQITISEFFWEIHDNFHHNPNKPSLAVQTSLLELTTCTPECLRINLSRMLQNQSQQNASESISAECLRINLSRMPQNQSQQNASESISAECLRINLSRMPQNQSQQNASESISAECLRINLSRMPQNQSQQNASESISAECLRINLSRMPQNQSQIIYKKKKSGGACPRTPLVVMCYTPLLRQHRTLELPPKLKLVYEIQHTHTHTHKNTPDSSEGVCEILSHL